MKTLRYPVVFICFLGLFGWVHAQEGPDGANEPETNRWIVQFEDWFADGERDALIAHVGGETLRRLDIVKGRAVRMSEGAAGTLGSSLGVKRVERDAVRRTTAKPGGGAQTVPWGISRIHAPQVWTQTKGNGVKVAVIDTGISHSHPDLRVTGGINLVRPGRAPNDDNGHGSHVAGTIAALDNSAGVVGVAPNASLYAVKVLNSAGFGYCSDIIAGMAWAGSNGMKVVNMSFGGSTACQSECETATTVVGQGTLLVAAAGNNYGGTVDYPGACPGVVAVSATTQADQLASFSSIGPEVSLAAPGATIYSTYKGSGYKTLSGTSMAAPHVSGVAALVFQKNVSWTPVQVRDRLQGTAECLFQIGSCPSVYQGDGLVDADAAQ